MKTDNVEQAREFLEQGADIHVRDREGNTLLHLAVSGKMVRLLLDLGADLYTKNNFGQTPLFLAIEESRVNVIPALLEGGIDANAPDSDGYTPLLAARDPAVAALLIRHGADVNARSKSGKTPLMDTSKDLDVLRVLVQAGAMLTARDDEGNTALHMAWDADVLPYLVHSGADINALNNKGESPLMSAARGTGDRLGTLLTLGANPSLRDKRGWTALMHALAVQNSTAMRLLQSCGASFSAEDYALLCREPDRVASMSWLKDFARDTLGQAFPPFPAGFSLPHPCRERGRGGLERGGRKRFQRRQCLLLWRADTGKGQGTAGPWSGRERGKRVRRDTAFHRSRPGDRTLPS